VSKAGRYQLVVVDEAGNSDRIEFRLENPPEGVVSARILTTSGMARCRQLIVDSRQRRESGLDLPQPGEEVLALALVEVALLDGVKHQLAVRWLALRRWIIAMAGRPVLTAW
jgi:hypothetical protein